MNNEELDFLNEVEFDDTFVDAEEAEVSVDNTGTTTQPTSVNWKQKLTSRKLWTAVVGVVVGLAAAFGLKENDWAQIAGIVTSAASVVAYIFGEAKIDAARKGQENADT